MKHCYGFCASECISGQCPQALAQSCDWYTDMGFERAMDIASKALPLNVAIVKHGR